MFRLLACVHDGPPEAIQGVKRHMRSHLMAPFITTLICGPLGGTCRLLLHFGEESLISSAPSVLALRSFEGEPGGYLQHLSSLWLVGSR